MGNMVDVVEHSIRHLKLLLRDLLRMLVRVSMIGSIVALSRLFRNETTRCTVLAYCHELSILLLKYLYYIRALYCLSPLLFLIQREKPFGEIVRTKKENVVYYF